MLADYKEGLDSYRIVLFERVRQGTEDFHKAILQSLNSILAETCQIEFV